MRVDVALVHVGGVRFPITGPVRYTMTAPRAVELCELVRPRVAVPVHYEGWAHFADGRAAIEQALGRSAARRSGPRPLAPPRDTSRPLTGPVAASPPSRTLLTLPAPSLRAT